MCVWKRACVCVCVHKRLYMCERTRAYDMLLSINCVYGALHCLVCLGWKSNKDKSGVCVCWEKSGARADTLQSIYMCMCGHIPETLCIRMRSHTYYIHTQAAAITMARTPNITTRNMLNMRVCALLLLGGWGSDVSCGRVCATMLPLCVTKVLQLAGAADALRCTSAAQ